MVMDHGKTFKLEMDTVLVEGYRNGERTGLSAAQNFVAFVTA